jgi:hypothetical protein
MTSIKPKPKKLIIHLLSSICIFILLVPSESRGAKFKCNEINSSIAIHGLSSGIDNSLYASLLKETTVPVDSSVLVSEKQKSQIPEKSKSKIRRPQNKVNRVVLWVLGDNNVSEFKTRMINFGNNNLPLFLRKQYIHLVDRTYTFPIIILFLVLIIVLIMNITLVLLVMYFTNKRKNHKERYISIYRNSYEEVLSLYLFGEIEWDQAQLKLKKLKKPLNRKILTDVLLIFKENLRGEMDSQIPQIFMKLGLEKDSLKLTKSFFYHNRIEGLKALTNLNPESAKEIIPNYLNDSHFLVRTEAQIAYVRLYPEKPFEFLKNLTSPFPRWTQLSSFYIFRLHQVPIPAFVDYLDSGIPTIRNFSLRMIIFFQQLENASAIYKLLESPLEMTRFLSIRAVNDLRLYEGKQIIKNMYQSETGNNKLEIIKAFKNIGNEDDFVFLESIIHSESISLKTEACRSLYYVNNEGRERLNFLNQNSDLKIDQFLAHVTDPRN